MRNLNEYKVFNYNILPEEMDSEESEKGSCCQIFPVITMYHGGFLSCCIIFTIYNLFNNPLYLNLNKLNKLGFALWWVALS